MNQIILPQLIVKVEELKEYPQNKNVDITLFENFEHNFRNVFYNDIKLQTTAQNKNCDDFLNIYKTVLKNNLVKINELTPQYFDNLIAQIKLDPKNNNLINSFRLYTNNLKDNIRIYKKHQDKINDLYYNLLIKTKPILNINDIPLYILNGIYNLNINENMPKKNINIYYYICEIIKKINITDNNKELINNFFVLFINKYNVIIKIKNKDKNIKDSLSLSEYELIFDNDSLINYLNNNKNIIKNIDNEIFLYKCIEMYSKIVPNLSDDISKNTHIIENDQLLQEFKNKLIKYVYIVNDNFDNILLKSLFYEIIKNTKFELSNNIRNISVLEKRKIYCASYSYNTCEGYMVNVAYKIYNNNFLLWLYFFATNEDKIVLFKNIYEKIYTYSNTKITIKLNNYFKKLFNSDKSTHDLYIFLENYITFKNINELFILEKLPCYEKLILEYKNYIKNEDHCLNILKLDRIKLQNFWTKFIDIIFVNKITITDSMIYTFCTIERMVCVYKGLIYGAANVNVINANNLLVLKKLVNYQKLQTKKSDQKIINIISLYDKLNDFTQQIKKTQIVTEKHKNTTDLIKNKINEILSLK